jgi:serine/threonine protein kinase
MDDFGEPLPGADEYDFKCARFDSRFADVFLGVRKADGLEVVLKHITRSEDADREIEALERIGTSPHVVKLISTHRSSLNETVIALEYVPEGDLRAWMDARANRPVESATVLSIVKSMLQSIATCQAHGIVHRDISPRNFLVKGGDSVVLADFGSSRLTASTSPARCNVGTLWYMAPETVFGSRHYSPKVDVFGVGCIAAELLRRKPLFDGLSQLDQICKMVETLGTPDESTWPELASLTDWSLLEFPPRAPRSWEDIFPLVDGRIWDASMNALIRLILDKMLVYNPERRCSAAECLQELETITVH